jgi:hypothetical protein
MHTLTPRLLGRSRRFGLAFTDLSVALAQGRVDDADALLEVVLTEGLQQYSEAWVTSVYASLLVAVRNAQGRLGELAALGEGLIEATPDFVTWRVLVAACALDNGDVEAARRHWDVARRDDLGGVIEDTTWTTVMSLAARVAVGLGDQESAAMIRQRLGPYSGRMMWSGVGIYDPVDESLALLADSEGDTEAAEHHRQIAAAMVERLRSI